jgi:NAD(P)-dependent dehydrogenase (short-subunit alcohol dehydrogenase family)
MHHVIVTGVSRGLGAALAAALLARGHRVVGVGRSTNADLRGEAYRFVACDLAAPTRIAEAVEPVFREIAAARPAAVTLVNNAAVAWPVGRLGYVADDELAQAMAVNAVAPAVLCGAFVRACADGAMRRRIVNVSSGAAQTPIAGGAAYCMAKAALEMLSRTLAAEHAPPELECISVRPGIIETDMQAYMRSHDPAHFPSVGLFHGFKDNGVLARASEVAERIAARLVEGDVEHGRTYSHLDF